MNLSPGTEILTVQAADNDDPKTDNVRIFYRLVGQIPESPRALFRVDRDSGVISVQADSMEGTAPQYTLTITAEDAKGDFGSMQTDSPESGSQVLKENDYYIFSWWWMPVRVNIIGFFYIHWFLGSKGNWIFLLE